MNTFARLFRSLAPVLAVYLIFVSLAACSSSSLPPELRGDTMPRPGTFLKVSTGDNAIDYGLDTYKKLADSMNFSNFVGYSEYDNTI